MKKRHYEKKILVAEECSSENVNARARASINLQFVTARAGAGEHTLVQSRGGNSCRRDIYEQF